MQLKFRESNQVVEWINKTNYSFVQHKNIDVSIFQIHLSTTSLSSKNVVIVISMINLTSLLVQFIWQSFMQQLIF